MLLRVVATVAVWVCGILTCFALLQRYSHTDGPSFEPSAAANEILASHRAPGRPLLVMAVHPRCPCTDASLAELSDLLARSAGACDALLLQFQPLSGAPNWPVDDSPRELGGMKVPVVLDRGGSIGAALGAATSGHAVFVDRNGQIRFRGGLTIARDHRGRSPGQDAILATLAGRSSELTSAPVFGCTLGPECGMEAKTQ
jgi:hypothetical protein